MHIWQCDFCCWLWFICEDFGLFASSSIKSSNLVSWWCTSPFEEGQALKPLELAWVLSWAMPGKTGHWCFMPCFGGLLGPHFSTVDLITFYPSGWLAVRGLFFFWVFFSLFFVLFCFFYRRCHRVSPSRGRPWLVQEGRHAPWQAQEGRGCAGRKHSWLGPGIFGCASCQLNHEQGSRCTQRWRLCCLPPAAIV